MKIPTNKLLMCAVLFVSFYSELKAQELKDVIGGKFVGKVTDKMGQPVAGARIVFIQEIENSIIKKNAVQNISLKTDPTGQYTYLAGGIRLPIWIKGGTFHIIVHKEGFKPALEEASAPKLGEDKEINFQLEPGEDSTTAWERPWAQQHQKAANAIGDSFLDAMKLMDQDKYSDAITEFNKALATLHGAIGDCDLHIGKLEDAQNAFEHALRLQPENAGLWINLGTALSKLGKIQEAQEAFKKAIELAHEKK
jgi:tetratricopeptide (TPR) repeat protein